MIQLDNTSFVSFQTKEELITTPKLTVITTETGSATQRESWFRKGKRTTRQEGGSTTTGSTFPAPYFKVLCEDIISLHFP